MPSVSRDEWKLRGAAIKALNGEISVEEYLAVKERLVSVDSQENATPTPLKEEAVTAVTPDYKTQGVDPKLPVQAIVTLVVAALAYFGVDLSPEASAALGVILGAVAAYFAPAPKTVVAPS